MDIMSLNSVWFFGAALPPIIWAAYRFFWSRYARPKARSRVVLGAVLAFSLGATPALLVWEALVTGTVSCRRCSDGFFSVYDAPFGYWLNVAILYLVAIAFLSGLVFSISFLARGSRHSDKNPSNH